MADIKVTLSAITDSFNRELDKAEKKSEGFSKNVTDKLNKIGDASIKLGTTLSVALTGAMTVAAGAAFALAKSVGNTADRLLDLSDITGATTDIIQEYQYVSNQAGVASEAFTNAAEGLVRRLSQVDDEGSRVNDVFKSLGIAIKDTNGDIRNGGELMDQTIMKLADMDNVMRRNAIGSQIFGGAWKDIAPILGNGSVGIQKLKDEAHSLGLVMSNEALVSANKFRAEVDKLSAISSGLTNQLGTKLAPMLSDTIVPLFEDHIVPALRKAIEFTGKLVDKFNALDPVAKNTAIAIGAVTFAIGPLLIGLGALIKLAPLVASSWALITGPIGLTVAAIGAAAVGIIYYWDELKTEVLKSSEAIVRGLGLLMGAFSGVTSVMGPAFAAMSTQFNVVSKALESSGDKIALSMAKGKVESARLKIEAGELSNKMYALIADQKAAADEADKLAKSLSNVGSSAVTARKDLSDLKDAIILLNGVEYKPRGTPLEQPKTIGSLSLGTTLATGAVDFGKIFTDAEMAASMAVDRFNEIFGRIVPEDTVEQIGQKMQAVQDMIAGSISTVAESLGNAIATGGNIIDALGRGVLSAFGSFLTEYGKKLVAYGLASEAFAVLQQAMLNPFTAIPAAGLAIAAGLALQVAGSAASRAASGVSSGGNYGSGTQNFTSGSVVTASDVRSDEPKLFMRGSDIYIAGKQYEAKLGR